MNVTAFDLAQRYVGIREIAGSAHHPLIQWWLSLCGYNNPQPDETPWCSAFVNGIAWELRLPRSKSAAARSWLGVGQPVPVESAAVGVDVVILKRGGSTQGPEVLDAPGHVGFYAGQDATHVHVLGGNQGDQVCVLPFQKAHVLGVRRLA